jgi:hypothetical protein
MYVLKNRKPSNVISETERYVSNGQEIIRLISLFGYWSDFAFNRSSFLDNNIVDSTSYTSLENVYYSYYNLLTGKSIQKYNNYDCYCQSYCYDPTGYNLY